MPCHHVGSQTQSKEKVEQYVVVKNVTTRIHTNFAHFPIVYSVSHPTIAQLGSKTPKNTRKCMMTTNEKAQGTAMSRVSIKPMYVHERGGV